MMRHWSQQELVGDPTPEIKDAADSYTDLSDIDLYLGTERDPLVRSISVIERPATKSIRSRSRLFPRHNSTT